MGDDMVLVDTIESSHGALDVCPFLNNREDGKW
jgi:hypothetical protein